MRDKKDTRDTKNAKNTRDTKDVEEIGGSEGYGEYEGRYSIEGNNRGNRKLSSGSSKEVSPWKPFATFFAKRNNGGISFPFF